jgi:hypothetical protein
MGSLVIGPSRQIARLYRPAGYRSPTNSTAVERILDWDFDQIIVDTAQLLRTKEGSFCMAFRWLHDWS